MSIEIAVVNGTVPTSAGTQSYESAGFGTPDSVIIFVNYANTTNNPESGIGFNVGWSTGSAANSWCAAIHANDNVSTTDTGRQLTNNAICLMRKLDGSATIASANFSAWATNGVTLDWTNVDASLSFDIEVWLIKGNTSVAGGLYQMGTTATQTITTGFKPNLVFGICVGANVTGFTTNAILSFGAAHNNSIGTVSQGMIEFSTRDALTSGAVACSVVRNDSFVGQLFADSQSWKGVAENFTSTGFDINPDASAGSDYIAYLALDTGDTDGVDITVVSSPTSTGTWSVTDPGFTPQGVILGSGATATVNTIETDDDGGVFGIGLFDGTTEGFVGLIEDDGASTTNNQSNYSNSNAVDLKKWNGSSFAAFAQGSFSSFSGSGYSLSFPSTVDSTARSWLSIAIKSASAGVTASPGKADLTITGFAPTASLPISTSIGKADLTITGFAPSITVSQTAAPGKADLTITGFAPTILVSQSVSIGRADLTLTGYTPSILTSQSASIGKADLTITGYNPDTNVSQSISVGKADLTITGYNPSILTTQSAAVGKTDLTITGFAPSVLVTQSAAIGKADLTITAFNPTAQISQTASSGKAGLIFTGYAPVTSVTSNVQASPGKADLVITGYPPVVQTTGDISVSIGKANLILTGYAPTVSFGQTDLRIRETCARADFTVTCARPDFTKNSLRGSS